MEVVSTVQPYEGEPRCIKRGRFRRRLSKTVSHLRCLGQDRTKNSHYWIFREVIGQFHCKMLLSSGIAKAELSSRSSSRLNRTTTSKDTVFFFFLGQFFFAWRSIDATKAWKWTKDVDASKETTFLRGACASSFHLRCWLPLPLSCSALWKSQYQNWTPGR